MNAAETYKARLAEVGDLIRRLEGSLAIHERRQSARSGDWGSPGDLDRIIDGLEDLIPNHQDRRCEVKHPTTCGEYAAYCMPDGRLICPGHAPESGYDPSECLDLETGLPARRGLTGRTTVRPATGRSRRPFRRRSRRTKMTAKGSKSARTPKAPKTPAQDAAPEVKIDAGTTVVLPNPADAPAPPKAKRSKKAALTVAEVPDWVKRAATRDTATEMATVPEAAPVADAPAPKKGRAPKAKAKPAANATPTATPGSLRAIGDAWLDSLRTAGHTPSTVSSYGNDLAIAYDHLGVDTAAATITEKQVAAFNASKGVVKKANGKPKAQPTILKTRRALRLALVWAAQKKLIAKAPYSAA